MSTKSISLEQRIPSGKEFQFELIAKKLVHVYNDHSINESFYAALRNDTVEGSLSRI